MAFHKPIAIQSLGITPAYWRVIGVYIDASQGRARIVLGGYVSAQIRVQGGNPVDQREYALGPVQFGALAASAAVGTTTYAAIATPCYEFIRAARRPCAVDSETGEGVLPDGTRYAADQVVMIGEQPTVPSEFADAVDV